MRASDDTDTAFTQIVIENHRYRDFLFSSDLSQDVSFIPQYCIDI